MLFSASSAKKQAIPPSRRKGLHDSARFDNGPGTFQFDGKRIKLPVIGWIKTREPLRFSGKPLSATVRRVADRWFVAVPVEMEIPDPVRESQAAVGIDLGVSPAVTLSNGEKLEGPKALRRYLEQLQRLSRALSRKVKGSSNWRKWAMKLARLHARIANIRQDWLHKTTTWLVRNFSLLGLEDLNVRGMLANEKLARHIADIGMSEFRRQLQYKAALYGAEVIVADRWFPSSKICSACGALAEKMPLAVREWTCACGARHDRDLNAAKNLERLALTTVSCTGSEACGEEGSGFDLAIGVKPASVKQESNLTYLGRV
nr:transposase [uncultured Gammaproteobacteria bacterium]BAL55739.1 transposase [uncultured Gammaproteobacteria bacterium]